MLQVALFTEGVDRNISDFVIANGVGYVALFTEGVDRNVNQNRMDIFGFKSPSSQRAWIEIPF